MKKILLVLALTLSLFLVACNNEKPLEALDVTIVSESYVYDTLDVDVLVALEGLEQKDLVEIANAVASKIYMQYSNEIHDTNVTLTIRLYSTQTAVDESNADYGVVTYEINQSFDKPGLAPGTFEN